MKIDIIRVIPMMEIKNHTEHNEISNGNLIIFDMI